MKKPLACIVNISLNNILSIKRALEFVGFNTAVIDRYENVEKYDLVVLPGVGAFSEAIDLLKKTKLMNSIEQVLSKKKSLLAICLGLQLLFEESEEFGYSKGISFFKGKVQSFENQKAEKKTFIGWNRVMLKKNENLFKNKNFSKKFDYNSLFFVHSFFVKSNEKKFEIGTSTNGKVNFSSIVKKDNVLACQFHPEKSGIFGLQFLKNIYIKS